jgi:hypothetical protein
MKPILTATCSGNEWGLVISYPTTVFVTNQVGGYACDHPEVEGFYVPLGTNDLVQNVLLPYFYGPGKYQGWCIEGIDEADADWLDREILPHLWGVAALVDRSRLDHGEEAWIPVVVNSAIQYGPLEGFVFPLRGWLTWENSD